MKSDVQPNKPNYQQIIRLIRLLVRLNIVIIGIPINCDPYSRLVRLSSPHLLLLGDDRLGLRRRPAATELQLGRRRVVVVAAQRAGDHLLVGRVGGTV